MRVVAPALEEVSSNRNVAQIVQQVGKSTLGLDQRLQTGSASLALRSAIAPRGGNGGPSPSCGRVSRRMLDRLRSVAQWGFAALALIVASAYPAFDMKADERLPTIDVRDFDIASQRLEDALLAYAESTGVEVFVDHTLAANRRSGAVKGRYSVEAALQHLLAGTGLESRQAADRAYTLVAESPLDPSPDRPLPWNADDEQRQFFASLQLAIKRVLCTRPETLPGQYRAALAMWIGPGGEVENIRVLGVNGREAPPGLAGDIQRMSLGRPPPAGLKQPITFVILPRPLDRTGDCPSLAPRPNGEAPGSPVAP